MIHKSSKPHELAKIHAVMGIHHAPQAEQVFNFKETMGRAIKYPVLRCRPMRSARKTDRILHRQRFVTADPNGYRQLVS